MNSKFTFTLAGLATVAFTVCSGTSQQSSPNMWGSAQSTAQGALGSIVNGAVGSGGQSSSGGASSLFGGSGGGGSGLSSIMGGSGSGGGGLGSMLGGSGGGGSGLSSIMGGSGSGEGGLGSMLGGSGGGGSGLSSIMGGGGSGGGGMGGMASGGGGMDSFYLGTGMLMFTDMTLNGIKSDTDAILTHIATIDQNVQNQTAVMQAKQALILSVAQMNLLVTQGKVIQTDPMNPNSGSNNSVSQVVDTIVNSGTSVNYGSMSGMSNYPSQSSGGSPNAGSGSAIPSIPVGPNTMGIFQIGTPQSIALSANPNGFLNMLQGASLSVATQVLSQIGTSVMGLVFNGANQAFSGLNATNVDNIMGNSGHILAVDHQVPQTLYPVSPDLYSSLQARGLIPPTHAGTESTTVSKIADGVYFRKDTPYDGAYVNMVEKGTGVEKMQFFSAISDSDLVTYSATSGNSQPGYGFHSRVNMNDALSGGAFGAVKTYNSQVGGGPNPYAKFAKTVAPLLPVFAENIPANNILTIPSSAYKAAERAQPLNLAACGSLRKARSKEELDRFAACFAPLMKGLPGDGKGTYMLTQNTSSGTDASSSSTESHVMVFGPTQADASALMARMKNSDIQVQQGRTVIVMDQLMLQYSRNVLTASVNLRNALQQQADSMTQQNAIDSITMLIANCDNMSLVLQRQIADYAADIQRLLTEQHNELVARDAVMSKAVDDVNASVVPKIRQLVVDAMKSQKYKDYAHSGLSPTLCGNTGSQP